MGKTKIEWATDSWNPIRARRGDMIGWHCERVSEGCRNCYAERMNMRLGTGFEFKPGNLIRPVKVGMGAFQTTETRGDVSLFLDEEMLLQPLRWKKPRMIFVGSMTDVFADFVKDEWLDKIFAVMALCPQHIFQVLTKRSARMREYMSALRSGEHAISREVHRIKFGNGPAFHVELVDCVNGFSNIWLGVSAEDQPNADARLPYLRATPAAVRFMSAEPLLGPITGIDGLDWVIAGGESGPNARPMHPDWARALRDQCAAAGVPFFFKQWGEWETFYDSADDQDSCRVPQTDGQMGRGATRFHNLAGGMGFHGERVIAVRNVGKKRAGRLLDGREHNEMPR